MGKIQASISRSMPTLTPRQPISVCPPIPAPLYTKMMATTPGADLGLTAGDFHFALLAVNYVTSDPAARVLAFYRKPLSRYGEVLECDQGKPVGALTVTRSGLTCGEAGNGNTNSSTDHEIRAGSPISTALSELTTLIQDPPALALSTLTCRRTGVRKRSRAPFRCPYPGTALPAAEDFWTKRTASARKGTASMSEITRDRYSALAAKVRFLG